MYATRLFIYISPCFTFRTFNNTYIFKRTFFSLGSVRFLQLYFKIAYLRHPLFRTHFYRLFGHRNSSALFALCITAMIVRSYDLVMNECIKSPASSLRDIRNDRRVCNYCGNPTMLPRHKVQAAQKSLKA